MELLKQTALDASSIMAILPVSENHETLIHQARLAGLGQSFTNLLQEVGNPLSLLIGRIEDLQLRLQKNTLHSQQLKDELDLLLNTAQKLAKFHRALRSISQAADQDPKTNIFLSKIVNDLIFLYKGRLEQKGILLRRNIPDHTIVNAKISLLSQTLMRLLDNAIEAVQGVSQPQIEISALRTERCIQIRVTDNGCGIPEGLSEEIMKPFISTKMGHEGLGLAVANLLIQKHEGNLYVDPNSKHTCFIIELPVLQLRSLR
jgi:C4-dicarboxylate-specific signal transduction histidine kinase